MAQTLSLHCNKSWFIIDTLVFFQYYLAQKDIRNPKDLFQQQYYQIERLTSILYYSDLEMRPQTRALSEGLRI